LKIWLLIAFALSVLLLFNFFNYKVVSEQYPQTIIVLNGPSSSGKSSIAKRLEEQLNGQYIKIGADEFSLMLLPERFINYNPASEQPKAHEGLIFVRADDEKGSKLIAQVGHYASKVFGAMPAVVAAVARQGNNMIVDAGITIGIDWLSSFVQFLKPFKVYFIKITAPLSVLEEREKQRNGLIGLARGQLESMNNTEENYAIPFDNANSTKD